MYHMVAALRHNLLHNRDSISCPQKTKTGHKKMESEKYAKNNNRKERPKHDG